MDATTVDTQSCDAANACTKLAGSNKMELLLFSLGTHELFGIDVFKVREVSDTPAITPCPNMPRGVEGVISLRGNIIPVISLPRMIKLANMPADTGHTMIVAEFARHTQAFPVHEVERIIRVDPERIKPPETMPFEQESAVTAITELDDGRLVSILDMEEILADVFGEPSIPDLIPPSLERERALFLSTTLRWHARRSSWRWTR